LGWSWSWPFRFVLVHPFLRFIHSFGSFAAVFCQIAKRTKAYRHIPMIACALLLELLTHSIDRAEKPTTINADRATKTVVSIIK